MMCLFNILYSESCVEKIQQFKIVTYMAHRNIHTSIQPKTWALGHPGDLTRTSITDIILKILYQCLRIYKGAAELLPFESYS